MGLYYISIGQRHSKVIKVFSYTKVVPSFQGIFIPLLKIMFPLNTYIHFRQNSTDKATGSDGNDSPKAMWLTKAESLPASSANERLSSPRGWTH